TDLWLCSGSRASPRVYVVRSSLFDTSSPLSTLVVAAVLLLFFLMIRPPPRSTLFPYTTLFRPLVLCAQGPAPRAATISHYRDERSEEHTSELQSHLNLVCRLLLEKKKQPRLTWQPPPMSSYTRELRTPPQTTTAQLAHPASITC